jgi:hypothetical protein
MNPRSNAIGIGIGEARIAKRKRKRKRRGEQRKKAIWQSFPPTFCRWLKILAIVVVVH